MVQFYFAMSSLVRHEGQISLGDQMFLLEKWQLLVLRKESWKLY